MKRTLLMTTALVAVVSVTNAWAAKNIVTLPENTTEMEVFEEDYSGRDAARSLNPAYFTDDEITIKNVYMQTGYLGENSAPLGMDVGEAKNEGYANISNKLTVTDGGRLDVGGPSGTSVDLFNVNAGEVNISNGGEIHADGNINISGGVVNLDGSQLMVDGPNRNMIISGGEINFDTKNDKFNGVGVEISDDNDNKSYNSLEITGGTINVSGKTGALEFPENESDAVGNYLIGTEINMSGGTLNINKDSGIMTSVSHSTIDGKPSTLVNKSVINLTDNGVINLSGELVSNINGADTIDGTSGTLNVKDENAIVNGTVSGINVNVEATSTFSKLFAENGDTGNDLASLDVQNGTFTVDKELDVINTINVAQDAELKIDGTQLSTYAKDASSNDVVINGKLTMTNEASLTPGSDYPGTENNSHLLMNGAEANLTDSDIEVNGNITMINTTLVSNSSGFGTNPEAPDYGDYGIWAEGSVDVSDSNTTLTKSYITANGDISITNGTHDLNDSRIVSDEGDISFNNATVNMNGQSIDALKGTLTLSGGVLNMNDTTSNIEQDVTFWAAGGIDINNGAVVNMNADEASIDTFYDWVDGDGNPLEKPAEAGNISISGEGTTINVNSANAEISSEGTISISDGATINIAQGGVLSSYRDFEVVDGDLDVGEKATISNTGIINLAGTLNANVAGEGGLLNAKASSAQLNGDLNDSAINVEATHQMSNLVSGTVGDLAELNVKNNAVFDFDKDAGTITSLDIANGSTLNVSKDMTLVNFANAGTIKVNNAVISSNNSIEVDGGNLEFSGNSAIMIDNADADLIISGGSYKANGVVDSYGSNATSKGNIVISGGNINNSNSDFESWKTITVSDGTINLNASSDLTALEGLTVTGGTLNVSDGELWSLGDVNLKGGNITLTNRSSISTQADDADDIFGEVSATNGDISVDGATVSLTDSGISADGDLNVKSGSLSISGGYLSSREELYEVNGSTNVSGGTLSLAEIKATSNGINVTGGEVVLGNNVDFTNDDINSAFTLSDGKITMNGAESVIGTNHGNGNDVTSGKFVMDGGTVEVSGSGTNYIEGGDIAVNAGEINVAQGSTLQTIATLDASDNPADTSAIKLADGATINLSGSLVSDVNGAGDVNVKTAAASINGDVNGINLNFDTSHTLSSALLGTVSDLSSLNVNSGTLTFDKAIENIANLNVGGTLDIGTNTVSADNVEFKDNSKLALRIAGVDNHGKLSANNFTISENNTTMNVTIDNGIVANGETKEFQVLDGTFDGYFANKIADNSRYSVVWGDKNGKLTITGEATASDVVADAGGSSANAGTAEAWDSVAQSSSVSESAKEVSSVLNNLSQNANTSEGKKAYVDALTALAPDVAPAVQQTATETANQVFGAVGSRLSGGSVSASAKGASTGGGRGGAVSGGHKGGGHGAAAKGGNHGGKGGHGASAKGSHGGSGDHGGHKGKSSGDSFLSKVASWVQGMYNKSELEDTSSSKGFDSKTSGLAFGFEKQLNEDVMAGVGYAYSQTDIDGFMRSTDVDTHTAILYAEYRPSNWYVNSIVTYGWSDYEEHKNVASVNVEAKYDAETFGLQAMTGYDFSVAGLGLTPEVGLRYVHIKQDEYKDSADQKISGNNSDILTGVIGAKVNKTWELDNGAYITPEIKVAATYDMVNDDTNSTVTLANGSAYTVEGESLDEFGVEFGAGVTAEFNDNVTLSLGYEAKFRKDYQDHTGILNAKYKF